MLNRTNLANAMRAVSLQDAIFELKLSRLQEYKGNAGACSMIDFVIDILDTRLDRTLESLNVEGKEENVKASP